jgi:PST family polysaccharide transporter
VPAAPKERDERKESGPSTHNGSTAGGAAPSQGPADPAEEFSPEEVVSRSTQGAATTTLIGLVGRAAGLVVTLLLTHLVGKAEYGNANLAMIVATVVNTLTLLSPQQALLTRHQGYGPAARVVHSFASLSGLFVGLLLAVVARPIVTALGQPEATLLLRVYCVALVLERFAVIPVLGLRYHLRFGDVARVDFVGDMSYVAVTLVTGFLGAGGVCLALGMVARHGAKLLVLLFLRVRVRPALLRFSREDRGLFGEVLHKSWPIHLGGFAEFLTLYLDNVFVGKFYRAAAEGLYAVGYTLVMTPSDTIAMYGGSAMVRALGLRDGEVRRRTYLSGLRYMGLLLFPIGAGAALCAGTLERALLPLRWHGVAPIMVGLSAGAMTTGLMRMAFMHLTGMHRMRAAGVMDGLRLVLFLLALAGVALLDPQRAHLSWIGWGVAAAFVVSTAIGLYISLRADGIAWGEAARAIGPAAAATLFMSGVVFGLLWLLGHLGLGDSPVGLLLLIGTGVFSYAGYLRLCHRPLYDEMTGWMANRLRRS